MRALNTTTAKTMTEEICTMFKWRSALGALATVSAFGLVLLAPNAARAEPAIQAVTSTQQAGTEVVRIELSEALPAVPTGFTIQSPPRIAIDLPGVSNAMGRSSVDINQGNLRSVSVAQAGERTRLVLNLKQASGYRASLQGKALLLVLDNGSGAAAVA
ncbi:MAG: AMIN domain-containing protein, partial [Rubrivivax sp.]